MQGAPSSDSQSSEDNSPGESSFAGFVLRQLSNPYSIERVDNEIDDAEGVPLDDSNGMLTSRSDDQLIAQAQAASASGAAAQDANSPGRLRMKILLWKIANSCMVLYLVPSTFCLLFSFLADLDSTCERPLHLWAVVQTIIQTLMAFMHVVCLCNLPDPTVPHREQEAAMRRTYLLHISNRLLSFLWFSWWVFGSVWTLEVFTKRTCGEAKKLRMVVMVNVLIQAAFLAFIALSCFCACTLLIVRLILGACLPPPGYVSGAPQEVIEALPTSVHKKPQRTRRKSTEKQLTAGEEDQKEEEANDVCGICLEEYVDGDQLRHLPCKHHFHLKCVDKWLSIRKSCPFCTRAIDAISETGSAVASLTTENVV